MCKAEKIWLIIAFSLILIGSAIFGGAMSLHKWDFSKLSTSLLETKEYTIEETYQNLSIQTLTADITILPSEDGNTRVVCSEKEKVTHAVLVEDGTLTVRVCDQRNWFDHIEIAVATPKITLYIPSDTYGTLEIHSHTGNVEIPQSFAFESIEILQSTGNVSVSASAHSIKVKTESGDIRLTSANADLLGLTAKTGKITVQNVTCREEMSVSVTTGDVCLSSVSSQTLTSLGTTGDLYLENVTAQQKILLERKTGKIIFEGIDAPEITVKTTSGEVKGSLLSEKTCVALTKTGKVLIPKEIADGICHISTRTGNITVTCDNKP